DVVDGRRRVDEHGLGGGVGLLATGTGGLDVVAVEPAGGIDRSHHPAGGHQLGRIDRGLGALALDLGDGQLDPLAAIAVIAVIASVVTVAAVQLPERALGGAGPGVVDALQRLASRIGTVLLDTDVGAGQPGRRTVGGRELALVGEQLDHGAVGVHQRDAVR